VLRLCRKTNGTGHYHNSEVVGMKRGFFHNLPEIFPQIMGEMWRET
jgi:hypothetical protein